MDVETTTTGEETAGGPEVENVDTGAHTDQDVETPETPEDTFSRAYVEKLRDENAKLRVRAQDGDELRHRLHTELVRATGRLADPADLEFADDHLSDPEALTASIDHLLESRPHLKSRKPVGDIGQGVRGAAEEPVSLLGILKNFA